MKSLNKSLENMRKIILALIIVFAIFLIMPATTGWKWRTYGGVFGSRGITHVAYQAIKTDNGVSQDDRSDLVYEAIRPGAVAPDTFGGGPYYLDDEDDMSWAHDAISEWIGKAENDWQQAGAGALAPENASYYMGIAAHYWADAIKYANHDNLMDHYEALHGEDQAYDVWDRYANHLEWQVEYYRPRNPRLIVQGGGTPYADLNSFLAVAVEGEDSFLDNWMDNTMRTAPGVTPGEGWWFDWVETRKIENFRIQAGQEPPYGSKEIVDLSTTLAYSSWVYAMGIQQDVGAPQVTFKEIDPLKGAYFAKESVRKKRLVY